MSKKEEMLIAIIKQNEKLISMLCMEEQLLRPVEVAEILKIDKSTVYSMARNGLLNPVRVGNSVRIKKSVLDDFIKLGGSAS